MTEQLNIFSSGSELRDAGIKVAVDHANDVNEGWSEKAHHHLVMYLKQNPGQFQAEDARVYAEGQGLPDPPVKQAWGGVIRNAAKEGLITPVGYAPVKNPKAHCAIVRVWTHNLKP